MQFKQIPKIELSEPVLHLVHALWSVRDSNGGRIESAAVKTWGRLLAEAVQAEARENDSYSPEMDKRVLWAREVIQAAVRGERQCRASAELEATMDFLLEIRHEPCGKDWAAGVDI